MAEKQIPARQKQRSDTAVGWNTANPVLLKGEIGYESDTGKVKLGDGATVWKSLAYATVTPGETILYHDSIIPPDNYGIVGQICVTPYGTYKKRQIPTRSDLLAFGFSNPSLNGMWRNMGINNTYSSSGGNPSGTYWYSHELSYYTLCWNTAYGGYWWINSGAANLTADNGSSYTYRSTPTYTEIPPSDSWSGSTVTWLQISAWTPIGQVMTLNNGDVMNLSSKRKLAFWQDVLSSVAASGSYISVSSSSLADGSKNAYVSLYTSSLAGNTIESSSGLYIGAERTKTGSTTTTAASVTWNIDTYPVYSIVSSIANATFTIAKSGSVPTSRFTRLKLLINNTNAANTAKTLTFSSWSITWDKAPPTVMDGGVKYAFEIWTYDGGTNWFGTWEKLGGEDQYIPQSRIKTQRGEVDIDNPFSFSLGNLAFSMTCVMRYSVPTYSLSVVSADGNDTLIDCFAETTDAETSSVGSMQYSNATITSDSFSIVNRANTLNRVEMLLNDIDGDIAWKVELFLFDEDGSLTRKRIVARIEQL